MLHYVVYLNNNVTQRRYRSPVVTEFVWLCHFSFTLIIRILRMPINPVAVYKVHELALLVHFHTFCRFVANAEYAW